MNWRPYRRHLGARWAAPRLFLGKIAGCPRFAPYFGANPSTNSGQALGRETVLRICRKPHFAIVRSPFRLNLNHPYFTLGVMTKAAPFPLRKVQRICRTELLGGAALQRCNKCGETGALAPEVRLHRCESSRWVPAKVRHKKSHPLLLLQSDFCNRPRTQGGSPKCAKQKARHPPGLSLKRKIFTPSPLEPSPLQSPSSTVRPVELSSAPGRQPASRFHLHPAALHLLHQPPECSA